MLHFSCQACPRIAQLNSLPSSWASTSISVCAVLNFHLVPIFTLPITEQPNIRVFSIHPGIVEAESNRGMVVDNFTPFAKDKQALTAGLTLYLQRPQADFLRGGFLSANWDVEEMEKHKDEIVEGKLLKLAFLGAKLGPEGHPWKN